MSPPSRRRVLRNVAGLTVGLTAGMAGCTAGSGRSGTETRTVTERDDYDEIVTDPDRHTVRHDSETPIVRFAAGSERATPRTPRTQDLSSELIATEETAARVRFGDGVDAGGARSFLDATGFDRESVYLVQFLVRTCERLDTCYVRWSSTAIEASLEDVPVEDGTNCGEDERVQSATFLRIPANFPGREPKSTAVQIGGCSAPSTATDERETAVSTSSET